MPSSSEKLPLRSILKNASSTKAQSSSTPSNPSAAHYQTALNYATQIQIQKDCALAILKAVEILLELPSSPSASPARPSSADISLFLNHLTLFQPSDYDELIEERNISNSCGYVLCPRPPHKPDHHGAHWRIVPGRGPVRPKELERWCSPECGARALFLRPQLAEEPVWLRGVDAAVQLQLLDEHDIRRTGLGPQAQLDVITRETRSVELRAKAGERSMTRATAPAVERGDKAPSRDAEIGGQVRVEIREKMSTGEAEPPRLTVAGQHSSVEGYEPRLVGKLQVDADNEADHDWGL